MQRFNIEINLVCPVFTATSVFRVLRRDLSIKRGLRAKKLARE